MPARSLRGEAETVFNGAAFPTGRHQHLARDQVLAKAEQTGRRVFLILKGGLVSYHQPDSGKSQICAFYFPGDIIPFAWPEAPMQVTLKAVTEAEVQVFTDEALLALFNRDAGKSQALFDRVASFLIRQQAAFYSQRRRSVEGRLAEFLLAYGAHLGVREGWRLQIVLPLRRCEIASYLGLRSETLSRIFARWRVDGLIEQGELRQITFPDIRRLQAIGRHQE